MRLDGYHSSDESKLKGEDCKLACPENNHYSKMAVVGKGKVFTPPSNCEIELQESHTFRSADEFRWGFKRTQSG